MGEAAVGHGRCPAALGKHLGQALQHRVVGDTESLAFERHVVAVDGDAEGAARIALDVPDLARTSTAAEVVAAVDPEGADGGHVGPAVRVDCRQPERVVAWSTGAGFLGQVGLERPAHIGPPEWGKVVEVGEIPRSGFWSSHANIDDRRRANSSGEPVAASYGQDAHSDMSVPREPDLSLRPAAAP